MQDWFGTNGVAGITEIVEEALDNMYEKELIDTRADLVAILHSLKDDRPDIVHKYMKYLKVEENSNED